MTERQQDRPELKRLTRQAVDVDFDGGTLTSDVGLVLLREVDRRLDSITRIDEATFSSLTVSASITRVNDAVRR